MDIRILNSSFLSPVSNNNLSYQKITEAKFEQFEDYYVGKINSEFNSLGHSGDLVEKYALAVSYQCLKDFKNKKVGVNIGSARGATNTWELLHSNFLNGKRTLAGTSPLTTAGRLSSLVAQKLRLEGVRFSHSITCSTGLHSILNACAWIEAGYSEYFLAGASEACVNKFTLEMVDAISIYSKDNSCRPFNTKKENTFILSEAAGVVLLGKSDYGYKISGFGVGLDPTESLTGITESGIGFQNSMKDALTMAKLDTVDCIIAHAPGTIKGDVSEINAVDAVFKERPDIVSTKFYTGHTFATSGLLSIELAILILENQKLPEITYDNYITNSKTKFDSIMINAAGFGGNTVSLIITK